jgi:hypothetical protein
MDQRDKHYGDKFLNSSEYIAMLRALFPQATFVSWNYSICAPMNLRTSSLVSEIDALIDSGTTDNFISPAIITLFKIPTQPLEKPQNLRNVDGTPNKIGELTQVIYLTLWYQGSHIQMFYVADLEDDYMLLRMPFLFAKNPKINWTSGIFSGKIEAWTSNVHYWPFPPLAIRATQMKEMLQSQFINFNPTIQQTTKSTAVKDLLLKPVM